VTMKDGGSSEVGLEHNWLAWPTHRVVKKGNVRCNGASAARKYTTAQIIEEMEKGRTNKGTRIRGFAIPVMEPAAMNVAGGCVGTGNFIGRPVDPYFLGLLLGDGSVCKQTSISITSADEEIAAYLRDLVLDDLGSHQKVGNAASSHRFRGEFAKKLWKDLNDIGVAGHRAATKHIPRQYLFAPTEARWALFQGLMDTDGWVEPKRACYYVTISKELAQDVAHLAMSLGAVVSTTEKHPTYTYNDEKLSGQLAYCLRIRIANPENCFRLLRKKEIAQEIEHQSEGRFIEKIEFSRKAEAVCIQVSHRNSLYITDDFIVTHNTELALGLAFTAHRRSLILRRQYVDLGGIIDRAIEINGSRDGFSGSIPPRLRIKDERVIIFGAHKDPGDEQSFQGQPYDLKVLDEAAQHLESQLLYHLGWLRSTVEGQRCRALLASNPPIDSSGDWMIRRYRPWLDPIYDKPAKPGELRWFITNPDGEDMEVDGPTPLEFTVAGKTQLYQPKSRTFIPAVLADNPYLINSGYQATLDALPEPMRSAFRDGNFMLARADVANQLIPTQWIIEAQNRWKRDGRRGSAMSAMGYDPAGGGRDSAELAMRFGFWYDEIVTTKGPETADGSMTVAHIFKHRRDNAIIVLDSGGGYAGQTTLRLRDNKCDYVAYNGNHEGVGRDQSGKLKFYNHRAEVWWRFREALDPDQPGGSQVCLPPGAELRADLTAPTYTVELNGIKIESKEAIKKRLGRSPGKGDAVVIAWHDGNNAIRKRDSTTNSSNPRHNLPQYAKTGRKGPLQKRRRP
jgi:hypothetical protein